MKLQGKFNQYNGGEHLACTASVDSEGISQINNLHSAAFEVLSEEGEVLHRFPMSVSITPDADTDPERALYEMAQYHMLPGMSLVQ